MKNSDLGRLNRSLYIKMSTNYSCEVCGGTYPEEVLEFHHRDPSKKEFGLKSSKWRSHRLNKEVFQEAAKCAILCSNCHRLEHVALKNGETLIYDKEAYTRYRNYRFARKQGLDGRYDELDYEEQEEFFATLCRDCLPTGGDQ